MSDVFKTGFLEKNNDALHGSLEQLLATSTDQFVQNLFPSSTANRSTAAGSFAKKLALESVSSKFKVSINVSFYFILLISSGST